ncbi:PREDICTED: uncharacterized protein LOC105316583 isoform X2 [Amphimedon queenslandica]|uniref:Uncharacterized protein n=1 Tax=Amphimedon queenslandica TaxID=400682 RepID=A0A1X7VKF0_AMPQE|nr:PREDICTED: uncharacterized protein LOC105316583 isoform X2 [Amphimedon queenslandica]|eukprot:XP_019864296.1 PREDICTED: uncharacterized protein LOC105316583 isoform X2 [Amphimedon queenslandica]
MMFTFLLVFLFALPLGHSLSCSSYTSSRTKTICEYYSSESSIYKARITASQCKCGLGSPTLFSCIDFRQNSSGSLVVTVQRLFDCSGSNGIYYKDCNSIINNLGISNASIINSTVTPETVSCVNISYSPEDYGCAVTHDPCYYTAVVEEVYKGSIQVGALFNTSGPHSITCVSSGQCVLNVGESYIVGIGGACYAISPWSSYNTYTSDDIELLEGLRDGGTTACNSQAIIIGVSVSLGVLLILVALAFIITIIVFVVKKSPGRCRRTREEVVVKVDDVSDGETMPSISTKPEEPEELLESKEHDDKTNILSDS